MSVNNNPKRKTRPPTNANSKPPRVKGPPERNATFEGVYGNARFMHSAASLVGCIVHVQVKNGTTYEGVFATFSQQKRDCMVTNCPDDRFPDIRKKRLRDLAPKKHLDIVLEMVNRVDHKNQSYSSVSSLFASFRAEDSICDKMIFKLSDIVSISAINIDLDFATREGKPTEAYPSPTRNLDGFTDNSISKYNGPLPERELEPWDAPLEDVDGVNILVEGDEEKNGWDVNEMFRTNAEKYNVKSTYDSSLPEYTIQLEPKNTDEYKKQEAKASKLANEIESSPNYRTRTNMENGDEEDRYSAVLRPVDNSNINKYAPRKRNVPGGKNIRTTPPPTSLHHSTASGGPGGVKGQQPHYPVHSPSGTPTHSYNKMVANSLPPSGIGSQTSMPSSHSNHGGHIVAKPPMQQMVGSHLGRPNSPRHPSSSMPPPVATTAHVQVSQAQVPLQDNYAEEALQKEDPRDDNKVLGNEDSIHITCATGKPSDKRDLTPKTIPTRGRDEQIAEFKKFSSDFKLSEDPKASKDLSSKEDDCESFGGANGDSGSGSKDDEMSKDSSLEGENGNGLLSPSDGEEKGCTLKKSTLNPNAKAFTPRAVPVATPPSIGVSVPPPRLHTQSPIMAVPQQLMTGLAQPLFTAMGPQYVMSATPGTMSLTPPFATATVTPSQRFRRVPMTVQPRHDFSQSVHVAAATGQPILAPAGIPNPPQLTVQYTHAQSMVPTHGHHHHHHHHHQAAMAYQQVMYPVQMGPRVMSPPSVGLVPTSHSGSYGEPHSIPTQVFMSPHPAAAALSASHTVSVSAIANMVPPPPPPQGPSGGPHSNPSTPGQPQPPSQTPVSMHTAPSPVHQQQQGPPTPTQTPTPTGGHPVSTPQPVVYHGQMQHATGPPQHAVPPTNQQLLSHHQHFAAVLMHQQAAHAAQAAAQAAAAASGVSTHGPHTGSLPSSPHSLQGLQGGPPPSAAAVTGHLGTPTHVISHPTMVIPTSAATMVHPFAPPHHQARDRGRQHTGNR